MFGERSDYTYLDMHGDSGDGPFDVDDSVNAFLRCADETTISLDVAWAANQPPQAECVVLGDEAGARLNLAAGELTIFETGVIGAPHSSDSTITTVNTDPHRNEQRHFIETIPSDTPLTVNTGEQAIAVQRVIDAIYRSSDLETDGELDAGSVMTVN